jgi:hypothetical protein
MSLLQDKKYMREQNDVIDCDAELMEIMRMHEFIGLTELPEALRQMTTSPLPTYWRLYRKATEEAFPVYRAGGRIFVREEDLPLIAEVFGLRIKT